MGNLLLEKIDYKIEKTELGTWRRYVYPTGMRFAEFRSHATWGGLPLLHYTSGICPETGKRIVAKGVIAAGRIAAGLLAIGQASFGLIAIGQLGLGLILGLGQASSGFYAVGQLAVGAAFGLGQLATGYTAIGQFAYGKYILAQTGFGTYAVLPGHSDPEALEHFRTLIEFFRAGK